MRIDPRKLLTFVGIVAWAIFFDYLWLSGESLRFVGSRTQWVVPFGGITLTIVSLLALGGLRRGDGSRVGNGQRAGLGVLIAPVLAIFLIPAPVLGALAARNKASSADYRAMAQRVEASGGPLTVYDIAIASQNPSFAAARGVVDGLAVKISGLVSDARADSFDLSRFRATCCAADAIPFTVVIDGVPEHTANEWVAVEGTIRLNDNGTFSIAPTRVRSEKIGDDAYLSS